MDKLERKPKYQQAEKKLQNHIERLEDRIKKTDQASAKAKEIRDELEKLKKKK